MRMNRPETQVTRSQNRLLRDFIPVAAIACWLPWARRFTGALAKSIEDEFLCRPQQLDVAGEACLRGLLESGRLKGPAMARFQRLPR